MDKDHAELIEFLGEKFEAVDQKFEVINDRFDQLPTKAYLDDKLADLEEGRRQAQSPRGNAERQKSFERN
ncbi:MAG: hypothetical protein A3C85_00840 [Candidatus Doudnabacteria bacterium RIFCSPHIGHO2_02_FULL_48_21]|uniref:Uncharacterized protein n=1 Tax=Candidatus Doudnabacteria bacterium RIFCSPLOWO2_02_FULL_48_13 TaxID=1817845 RepID=A0A1F5QCE5_9BACT|nr:MAG: hypothetical protein A3K05_01775 [Candidatus Doudnabacteria bacterium RIFCSPHIGHO2_01_48_18]OGE77310.1 MAG: hypothetical protein A2668_02685 [Candidatus Doudnabacteria bacterium RIFCSPHIGHO2_01_FULL_48_180]OGE91010.1 MAG: hypothetical protein A3F44_01650 [Candidatus Doudnabacteria bacterium RIFCSPHIGHO2_12_FULL_47_25]OGE92848.1 MAG: hypothetical protein A3C85_00840 [Candidatus Doudnabacteria bacterium RIFCSPHIGHO2_02_FULL_48_21]OGE96881.1 MAG: hypothetical protein A3A83_04080 [Candidatu